MIRIQYIYCSTGTVISSIKKNETTKFEIDMVDLLITCTRMIIQEWCWLHALRMAIIIPHGRGYTYAECFICQLKTDMVSLMAQIQNWMHQSLKFMPRWSVISWLYHESSMPSTKTFTIAWHTWKLHMNCGQILRTSFHKLINAPHVRSSLYTCFFLWNYSDLVCH